MADLLQIVVYAHDDDYSDAVYVSNAVSAVSHIVHVRELEELLSKLSADGAVAVLALSSSTTDAVIDVVKRSGLGGTVTILDWKPSTKFPFKLFNKFLLNRKFVNADFYVFFGN